MYSHHYIDLISAALQAAESTNDLMLAHYAGLAREGHEEALGRIVAAVRYDFSALDTSPFSDGSKPRAL